MKLSMYAIIVLLASAAFVDQIHARRIGVVKKGTCRGNRMRGFDGCGFCYSNAADRACECYGNCRK